MNNKNKILKSIKNIKSLTYIELFNYLKKNLLWNSELINDLEKLNLDISDEYNNSNKTNLGENYIKNYKNINKYTKKIFKHLVKKENIKLIKYIYFNIKKKNLNEFLINFKDFKATNNIKNEVYKIIFKKNKLKYIKLFLRVDLYKNNVNIIIYLYKILCKIYFKIKRIKYRLYDIFCNLSNISLLKFNFYFFYYGSNLYWLLDLSDLNNFSNNFIKKYIKIIKNYKKKIINIEKIINIKLIDFIKFFNLFLYFKIKIENNRDNIIKLNLNIVKNYCKIYFNSDLYSDYIQEGNIGLVKAVNKYNLNCKVKFKNFVLFNIKSNIGKFLYKNIKLFKIPKNIFQSLKKINNIVNRYKLQKNDIPSLKYISKEMYIKIEKLMKIMFTSNIEKSLDRNINNSKLLDFTENNDESYKIEKFLIKRDLVKNVKKNFKFLNKNEIEVLKSRFNLNEKGYFTLLKIGKKLNLSKERIRQIQNEALNKIRNKCKNLI